MQLQTSCLKWRTVSSPATHTVLLSWSWYYFIYLYPICNVATMTCDCKGACLYHHCYARHESTCLLCAVVGGLLCMDASCFILTSHITYQISNGFVLMQAVFLYFIILFDPLFHASLVFLPLMRATRYILNTLIEACHTKDGLTTEFAYRACATCQKLSIV